jgi:hypothetical protein
MKGNDIMYMQNMLERNVWSWSVKKTNVQIEMNALRSKNESICYM